MDDMMDPEALTGEVMLPEQQTPQKRNKTLDRLLELADLGNIAKTMEQEELTKIAGLVDQEYEIDLESMAEWLKRMERGIKLANMQKEEHKSYPWPNAANVVYPLVTEAAMAFNAKAYPAVVPSGDVVQCAIYGSDPDGKKAARGERVSTHMSYDLSTNVVEWEEETDKLLMGLPIVGTMVRKWWFDPALGRKRCRNLLPGKFVTNDMVQTLDGAPRCTEVFDLYPNEIEERIRDGRFRDIDYAEAADDDTMKPECFLEQHRRIDLDGDGYAEPYIVTMHKETLKIARIVADFTAEAVGLDDAGNVLAIERDTYFVPFHMIPSMDGRFFSTGLGLLLGDISETINGILNMLLDAGHQASLGGGFIGREFRIKGGSQRFRPGEWKTANESGGDIKSAIVPITFPGPDATLFALLGMLIDAGKAIAAIKDITTGDDGGKVQTATTTLALIEQGMAVFTAAYKRIFRSLKQEFRLVAKLSARTVSAEEYNAFHDIMDENGQPMQFDPSAEYDMRDADIVPVADPASVTRMQELAKAQVVMQMAETGLVDKAEGARRALEAARVADVDALIPKPDPMAQEMAQLQVMMAKLQAMLTEADGALKKAQTTKTAAEAREVEMRMQTPPQGEAQDPKPLMDAEAKRAELEQKAIQSRDELVLKAREHADRTALEQRKIDQAERKMRADAELAERRLELDARKAAADSVMKQQMASEKADGEKAKAEKSEKAQPRKGKMKGTFGGKPFELDIG